MAAAVAPDAQEGHFVLRVLGQAHGFVGGLDGVTVDLLDDVALLEAGFGGGRVGLDFGDDYAFDVVGELELLPGLLVQVADGDAVEGAVVGAVGGVVLGELLAAGQLLDGDFQGLGSRRCGGFSRARSCRAWFRRPRAGGGGCR